MAYLLSAIDLHLFSVKQRRRSGEPQLGGAVVSAEAPRFHTSTDELSFTAEAEPA